MDHDPLRPALDRSRFGIIEVEVNDLAQLFNSIDPTPFPEKDLDRGAEEFITGWAAELPKHLPLLLVIHLKHPTTLADPARVVQEGVQAYFLHKTGIVRRRLMELLSRGRLSLVIGVVFLSTCLVAANYLSRFGTAPLLQILRESLIIGGWVAMWRPMEIFLYGWWPLLHESRICQRLSEAKVEVVIRANQPGSPRPTTAAPSVLPAPPAPPAPPPPGIGQP